MRAWWGERTPYVTLVAAVIGLAALLGANAVLAGTAEGSAGPPGVVSQVDGGVSDGTTRSSEQLGDVDA